MLENTARKQKILFLITKSNWGGAQKYVFDLATNLDKDKFEVSVALGGDGDLVKKLKEKNIEIVRLSNLKNSLNPFSLLAQIFAIRKILKIEMPDILHMNSSFASLAGVFATSFLNIKKVFTAHGWTFNEDRSQIQKTILFYCFLFICVFSDEVVCVSEKVKTDLLNKINYCPVARLAKPFYFKSLTNKMKVINLSISEPIFSDKLPFEINKEKINIVTIAELHKIKGHDVSIKALAKIKKEFSINDFVYHLIGSGAEKENLEKLTRENDLEKNVIFHGAIIDANKHLKNFDLFLFTSQSESFGYVLLEAALAGLPIVTHNVGAAEEILKDYNQKKILNIYNYKDRSRKNINNNFRISKDQQIDDLALILKEVLVDAEKKFLVKDRQDAIENIKRKFNISKMTKSTEEIYSQK